ncbi:hypothetical protein HYPSUDRAFT_33003 [Hypholoma sublateritium FD-334 SS-4]|uniref:Uncharacterized protein n=1 Tax=Hypholoma sublateritium (strain FD-334 SS-4) TaxID=945553 RepID=A0A0D2PFI6_HYPSF|nr:hypothetical protein HYPSUDRAFT_33003 [Hypholoma sublateritium FD-334 SS-4]
MIVQPAPARTGAAVICSPCPTPRKQNRIRLAYSRETAPFSSVTVCAYSSSSVLVTDTPRFQSRILRPTSSAINSPHRDASLHRLDPRPFPAARESIADGPGMQTHMTRMLMQPARHFGAPTHQTFVRLRRTFSARTIRPDHALSPAWTNWLDRACLLGCSRGASRPTLRLSVLPCVASVLRHAPDFAPSSSTCLPESRPLHRSY